MLKKNVYPVSPYLIQFNLVHQIFKFYYSFLKAILYWIPKLKFLLYIHRKLTTFEMYNFLHHIMCKITQPQNFKQLLHLKSGNIQYSSSHKLPWEPVQPFIQSHTTSSITALNIPASATAQFMETKKFSDFFYWQSSSNILKDIHTSEF